MDLDTWSALSCDCTAGAISMQTKTPLTTPPVEPESRYWFARHSKSIIFLGPHAGDYRNL